MKRSPAYWSFILAFTGLAALAFSPSSADASVGANYLYNLSDFTGTVPYDKPRISVDRLRDEFYVLYQNSVAVYISSGMETARFSIDLADGGRVYDMAVDETGDILAIVYTGPVFTLVRCNYRGEPRETFGIRNPPGAFASFSPNRLVYRDGMLYMADTNGMRVVVTDAAGNFVRGYDLVPLLELEEEDREVSGIFGFNVDRDGNILFTIPVFFRAYRIAPDGTLRAFGERGSTPGKFNIVGGIAADDRGNYLVTDLIKCAVIVFDGDFKFVTQFSARGLAPGMLIAPQDLLIDGSGRVYVTQGRQRGVSVFMLGYD